MNVKRLCNVIAVFVLLVVSTLIPIDNAEAHWINLQSGTDSISAPAVHLGIYHLSKRTLADPNM